MFLTKKLSIYLIVVFIGAIIGWKVSSLFCEADKLKALENLVEQYRIQEAENNEIVDEYLNSSNKTDVEYRYIDREIIRYVENNTTDIECLTPDGVSLWNSVIEANIPEGSTQ